MDSMVCESHTNHFSTWTRSRTSVNFDPRDQLPKMFIVRLIERNVSGNEKLEYLFIDNLLVRMFRNAFWVAKNAGTSPIRCRTADCAEILRWRDIDVGVFWSLRSGCAMTLRQCLHATWGQPSVQWTASSNCSQKSPWFTPVSNLHLNPTKEPYKWVYISSRATFI